MLRSAEMRSERKGPSAQVAKVSCALSQLAEVECVLIVTLGLASQPLSEAATLNNTPRKIRLTTPASTIADGPSAGGGASAPGGVGVPGTIDDEDGRLWLENGRKETKKQQAKRLAQERRDKKGAAAVPPPGPAAAATEDDASSKKKKGACTVHRRQSNRLSQLMP